MSRGGIVIFGGTAEGRGLTLELCRRCPERVILASVATGWGRALLEKDPPPNLRIREGRLDKAGMTALLREGRWQAVVDATHPYAREASENIRAACEAAYLPCLRLRREETPLPGCQIAADILEAADLCRELTGNILLTTGARDLGVFCRDPALAARVWARVLPMAESLEQCRLAGIPPGRIIAMQGPFSHELNLALLRQLSISVLVTKDGGRAGGMPEKLSAAREQGVQVVVIRRPEEQGRGYTPAEIVGILTKGEGQE